jgi:hypothetical protein
MANTLTALAPTLFDALGTVAGEPAGVLDSIDVRTSNLSINSDNSVTIPVAPVASTATYTPAMTTTAASDQTASSITITYTANLESGFNLTGEDIRSLENGGDNMREWVRQNTEQSMRALRNAAAAAASLAIKQGGSRAYGTAGTTPFASDLTPLTNARKILRDNGAPMTDLQCVVDSSSYLNLINLGVVQQSYMAGSDAERRSGAVGKQFGFSIREDGNIASHTKGTGTGYDIVGAGEAVGQTVLSLEGGSSGTILAGDIVTFSGGTTDANKYCVVSGGTATGAASGTITIGNPGLKIVKVDADEMTIGNSYSPNFAFERNAVVGFMRAPYIPENSNIKTIPITDPKTGLSFTMCEITGDGMIKYRLHLAYGFKVIQSEYVVIILG